MEMGLGVRTLGFGSRIASMRRQRLGRGEHVCSWRSSNADWGRGQENRGGFSVALRGEVTWL